MGVIVLWITGMWGRICKMWCLAQEINLERLNICIPNGPKIKHGTSRDVYWRIWVWIWLLLYTWWMWISSPKPILGYRFWSKWCKIFSRATHSCIICISQQGATWAHLSLLLNEQEVEGSIRSPQNTCIVGGGWEEHCSAIRSLPNIKI
jgi:hypothetical protein